MIDFRYIKCPVCQKDMQKNGSALKCTDGHCYDFASAGYVNLLSPMQHGRIPGDNKDMVKARRAFLETESYKPLAEMLGEISMAISPCTVIDAGCGDGYYTEYIYSSLKNTKATVMGFDISKFAVEAAARKNKDVMFFAANVHNLPVKTSSADLLICCFCAADAAEFSRVLSKDADFIYVFPGEEHLFEMKSIIYDNPYKNDAQAPVFDNFCLNKKTRLKYTFELNSSDDIKNLLSMTPYYWKSPEAGLKTLLDRTQLSCTAEFIIAEYKNVKV